MMISPTAISPHKKRGGINWSSYWTTRTPTALILTVLSDTSIKLDWTNGADEDYDGLRIYSSTDGLTFTELDTVAANAETYTAATLTENHYWFYVVAYKGSNESPATDTESNDVPLILYDGNTMGFWDYQNNDTLTDDGGGLISKWEDSFGSGHDLTAATTARPTLGATGMLFNGTSNIMQATYVIPYTVSRYYVLRVKTNGVNAHISDGKNAYTAGTYYGGANKIIVSDGFVASSAAAILFNALCLVRTKHLQANTASIQVNKNAAVTVDFSAHSRTLGGITIGARGDRNVFSNTEYCGIIDRKIIDSAEDSDAIANFLASKYAFFLT